MQKHVSRESRNRQGTVGYLLVAQLVGDGEGQVETVVFGKYAFPLRAAHTAQVCNSCSGDTKHILIRTREAPASPGRPRPRPEGPDLAWKVCMVNISRANWDDDKPGAGPVIPELRGRLAFTCT